MTPRKKKGIGFGISGLAFLVGGVVFYFTESSPDWVVPALNLAGMIAGFFGFTTVFPDVEG